MAEGFVFALVAAAGQVSRVLRLTGLDVTLPLASNVATALGDGGTNQYPRSRC